MSNKDKVEREVSADELEQLKNKYPQMAQKFEEVKKQAYQLQIQGFEQTQEQQAYQPQIQGELGQAHYKQAQQQLQNMVQLERKREQHQNQQTS